MKDLENRNSIKIALDYLKKGDIIASKSLMGITPDQIEDRDFEEAMRTLENGLTLFKKGYHPQAAAPLRKALSTLKVSSNEEIRSIVSILADFSDGISNLFAGDAHKAETLLNLSTEAIDRLSFFISGFEKVALSCSTNC